MILRPQLEPTDHQSVLDYYLENYGEVHIVSCDKCKNDLALEIRGEVFGQSSYKVNEAGYTVLPFGDQLLASRVRTDEHTPGIRMMGYQCACGNDTRGSAIEEELSPTGSFLPHEVAAIKNKYRTSGYKPKFKRKGQIETHESFSRERIK